MLHCTHSACRTCMCQYFTQKIREELEQRPVIICPFCVEPSFDPNNDAVDEQIFNYLALIDPFVRYLVEVDVYQLFQRKVRDYTLGRDSNFMWCALVSGLTPSHKTYLLTFYSVLFQCSSGFIAPTPEEGDEEQLAVTCPDCSKAICRLCKRPVSQMMSSLCVTTANYPHLFQWKEQHESLTCEKFEEWETRNDPQFAEEQLNTYLDKFGVGR